MVAPCRCMQACEHTFTRCRFQRYTALQEGQSRLMSEAMRVIAMMGGGTLEPTRLEVLLVQAQLNSNVLIPSHL